MPRVAIARHRDRQPVAAAQDRLAAVAVAMVAWRLRASPATLHQVHRIPRSEPVLLVPRIMGARNTA
jgi:hypothetical protein